MGAYPSKANREKTTRTSAGLKPGSVSDSFEQLAWATSAMQGWRASMEDADVLLTNFIKPGWHLFGVFDGHGGSEVSQQSQRYYPHVLQHVLNKRLADADADDALFGAALTDSFLLFDRLIESDAGVQLLDALVATSTLPDDVDAASGDMLASSRISTAGSTAVVCLMVGRRLYVANAGDSRCVLCRSGANHNLSRDHKPDDEPEYARIVAAGGIVADGRVGGTLNLSRAFGDFEFKQNTAKPQTEQMVVALPEIQVADVDDDSDEFLVLGCDGLFERLTWKTLVQHIRDGLGQGLAVDAVAERVLDHCCAPVFGALGTDNMTIQIILLPTTAGRRLIASGVEWAAANPPELAETPGTTELLPPRETSSDEDRYLTFDDLGGCSTSTETTSQTQ